MRIRFTLENCMCKNRMSFARKTYDTDSIVLRTIVARTPTDQNISSGKVLVAQGDGSTAWMYPSTLPGVPAFTRVIGNGTNIDADNLSSAIVFSTLDSMGMIANSTTKQISLYAKAFTTIDVSGGNAVTAFNTTNNTLTPTVELVGAGGIQIASDPQTNKIYFQTTVPAISTGIYGYSQVNVLSNAPSTITDSNFSTNNTVLTALSPSTVLQLAGLGDIILRTDVTNQVTYIGISTFTTASFQAVSTATGQIQTSGSTLSTTIGSNISSLWFSTLAAANSTNTQFQSNFNNISTFYTPLNDYQDLSTFTHSTLANTTLASTFSTVNASTLFATEANISSLFVSSFHLRQGSISSTNISTAFVQEGIISSLVVSSLSGIQLGGNFSTSILYVQGATSNAVGYESLRYNAQTSSLLLGTDISNNSMKIDLVNKQFFAQSDTTYPSLSLGIYPNSSNYSNVYIDPTGIDASTDDTLSVFTLRAKNITLDNPAGFTIHNSASTLTHHLMPEYSDIYDLGAPDLTWRDLYLSSGSIYLSTTKISLNSNGELQISIGGASNIPIGGVSSFASTFTENAFVSSLTASSITAVNFIYLSSVQDSYYISTTNLDAEEISFSTCFGDLLSTQNLLVSTINGVEGSDYIVTGQLTSSITGLATSGYISSTQLTSTVTGLGLSGYISSTQLNSTVTGLTTNVSISSLRVSTITQVGSASISSLSVSSITQARSAVISSLSVSSIITNVAIQNTLFVSTNNVGIGTATPQTSLDIYDVISTPITYGNGRYGLRLSDSRGGGIIQGDDINHSIFLRIARDGSSDTIDFHEYGTFRWFNGGLIEDQTEKMRITNTGNVGIGTGTPASALDVNGTVFIGNTGSNTGVMRLTTQSGDTFIQSGTSNTSGSASKLFFTSINNTSTTMTLDMSTLRVGIGTTTPETHLHVNGTLLNTLCNTSTITNDANFIIRNALDTTVHRIQFYTALNPGAYNNLTGTNDKAIIVTDGTLETGNLVIGPHSGSAYGMKIMSNGRVGIGVATPAYTLDVAGSINGSVGVLSNGTFLTSDRRVKENIDDANLDICYSNFKSLPLRRFTFISSFKTTKYDGSQIGFIADEVSSIFPKSVTEFQVDISGFSTIHHVNFDQIFLTNYGATKKLVQIVESHVSILSTNQQITEQRFSTMEALLQVTQSTCVGLHEEVSTLKG